jgi:hypothetical protein
MVAAVVVAAASFALGGPEGKGTLPVLTTRAEAAEGAPYTAGPTVRLITQSQYLNTIHDIFGSDINVSVRFAPVNRVDGLLASGSSSVVLTSGGLDPLEASARSIAEQVVSPERRAFLIPCRPADARTADAQCAQAFLARVGRLLYRRALTGDEVGKFAEVAARGTKTSGSFYDGLAFALSGMLVSPNFLFILETVEPDPAVQGAWRLDAFSRAAKLSFLLWNSSPDETLIAAAERGELGKPDGLRREVDRMIASPAYRNGVRGFFSDFFALESFDTLAKDASAYPGMTLKAVGESREQLLRTVVDHLVDQRGDYRDLYTTRKTFLTADLGVLYRLPVNANSVGWTRYEFSPRDTRGGLLTQVAFLSQYAHPARSSPTRRGRAIREVLLCQHVPDPPPNVDFSNFEDPKSTRTARERLIAHQENPVCAGCHKVTDPIGLSLENYDGAGQFRTLENGATIDASGSLDGVAFHDAVGLGKALRDNASLKSCIVNRLYAYSVGRKVKDVEEGRLDAYQTALDQSGYRFDTMLRMIVLDPSFFTVKPIPGQMATASRGGLHAYP